MIFLIAAAAIDYNLNNELQKSQDDVSTLQAQLSEMQTTITNQNQTLSSIINVLENYAPSNTTIPDDYAIESITPIIPSYVSIYTYSNGTNTITALHFINQEQQEQQTEEEP